LGRRRLNFRRIPHAGCAASEMHAQIATTTTAHTGVMSISRKKTIDSNTRAIAVGSGSRHQKPWRSRAEPFVTLEGRLSTVLRGDNGKQRQAIKHCPRAPRRSRERLHAQTGRHRQFASVERHPAVVRARVEIPAAHVMRNCRGRVSREAAPGGRRHVRFIALGAASSGGTRGPPELRAAPPVSDRPTPERETFGGFRFMLDNGGGMG
jgi:hypothetical protein